MLRGAIWDLDGTILDSMSAWDHVGENYLRNQGIEPEPDLDEAIATMSLHQAADYFIEHYGVKQNFWLSFMRPESKCVLPLLQSAPSWKLPWHVAKCLIISVKSLPAPL